MLAPLIVVLYKFLLTPMVNAFVAHGFAPGLLFHQAPLVGVASGRGSGGFILYTLYLSGSGVWSREWWRW